MIENKDKVGEMAYGAGAAFGVFLKLLVNLGLLWVNLWVLNYFGWLPF